MTRIFKIFCSLAIVAAALTSATLLTSDEAAAKGGRSGLAKATSDPPIRGLYVHGPAGTLYSGYGAVTAAYNRRPTGIQYEAGLLREVNSRNLSVKAGRSAKLGNQLPPKVMPLPTKTLPSTRPSHHTRFTGLGFGVGAVTVAADAECTYERRIRRVPGGGVQRVLVKVCPAG